MIAGHRMIGAIQVDRPSTPAGTRPSFSASLIPSARLCSNPNGPTRFGPCASASSSGPCEQDRHPHRQQQEHEMATALAETSHHGSCARTPSGPDSSRRPARSGHRARATPSVAWTALPGEFSGSHATRRHLGDLDQRQGDRAAIDGRDQVARRHADSGSGPGPTTGPPPDRAVPARYGSPSCNRPLSNSIRQVARTACPCRATGSGRRDPGGAAGVPPPRVKRSRRGPPRADPDPSRVVGQRRQHPQIGGALVVSDGSNGRVALPS